MHFTDAVRSASIGDAPCFMALYAGHAYKAKVTFAVHVSGNIVWVSALPYKQCLMSSFRMQGPSVIFLNSIAFGSAPRREAVSQSDRNTHFGFFVTGRHGSKQWGE